MMTLAQCQLRAAELMKSQNQARNQHIQFNDSETRIYVPSAQDKIYIPTPTGQSFHDDNSFIKLIMGPYGSGKSTLCQHEIIRRACAMPKWSSGQRRSRWAIVRNTSGELQSTTLQTWLTWFGSLGDVRKRQKPILFYEHTFNDGNGIVVLELIFIALDRPDDVRKIKSLELTGVYLNELSELPFNVLSHFKGRVNGRYPSKSFCVDEYWSGIIADTNPPPDSHWIYKDFEERQIENYKLFRQPPGLLKDKDGLWVRNPHADNSQHLSSDYYIKLAQGQTEEFVKVYCLGKWGSVGTGKVVYPEFNSDIHAVNEIDAIQGELVHLCWDGGLTPACAVMQMSERGQLRILKEYIGMDMGIRTFAESVVIPGLQRDFPYCKIGTSVFDPAGGARDAIIEDMSCIGELNNLGIKTEAARTNDVEARISSVRFFLNRMIDGKPAFILSKKGCPTLYNAFVKDYVYKQLSVPGEIRYKDKPEKNMASHISDAVQYGCLEFASERILHDKSPKETISMWNPVMRWSN